jgi:hypothetical protein
VRQTLRGTSHAIQVIRTDRGGEFVNKAAAKYYDLGLIQQELTAPYNLKQNGVAERDNHTVMELVRSMIHSQQTPPHFWAEATQTTVYVLNRTLSRTLSYTPMSPGTVNVLLFPISYLRMSSFHICRKTYPN